MIITLNIIHYGNYLNISYKCGKYTVPGCSVDMPFYFNFDLEKMSTEQPIFVISHKNKKR